MGCAPSFLSRSKDEPKESVFVNDISPLQVVLSEQHKQVLVKNWEILSSDLSGRGARIFLLIFGQNPLIKSIFSFGHLDGEELMRDPRFKGHALRFMQAVGVVIDNIDNYGEALGPLLNDLGRRHTQFKGFKPIYFNEFQASIMQVFEEDLGLQFTPLARESWKLVLLFILTELKRGFTHCLKEKAGLQPAAISIINPAAALPLSAFDALDTLAYHNGHSAGANSHDVTGDVISVDDAGIDDVRNET